MREGSPVCYALYIGTDAPIETDPAIEPRDRFQLFALERDEDFAARSHFSKPHAAYAASWQGCGCGWFNDNALFQRPKKARQSREKTGDQQQPPKRRVELTLADFEADCLPMDEGDFAVVTNGA